MSKIRYVDTYCQGMVHLQFNASLLAICSFVVNEVEYRGAQDILSMAGNPQNVLCKKMFVVSGDGRCSLILRYLIGAILNIWQLLTVPRNTILIYNYNNLFSAGVLNFINKIFGKRVIFFCHGEMELLVADPNKGGVLHKLLTRLARNFFLGNCAIAPFTRFFVMGDAIYSNLSKIIAIDKMSQFCKLDHSYIFSRSQGTKSPDTMLNFGTVGVLSPLKGGDSLCLLADMLKQRSINNMTLSVTGRIHINVEALLSRGISLPSNLGNAPIDQHEFANRIESLDFILFLYKHDSYKLTASGAIMDAIDRRRPVIAIKNDYFSYLFNKYGEFGYLVEDIQEMFELIVKIVNGLNEQHVFDFDTLQGKLFPMSLAKDFDKQLRNIGFI